MFEAFARVARVADVVQLAVCTATYLALSARLRETGLPLPTPTATWALLALLTVALWASMRWRSTAQLPARAWAVVAGFALLGALVFAGANFAMDALHGAQRPKAQVAAHLGGLELWFVLCPGVLSVALGRLAGCIVTTRREGR